MAAEDPLPPYCTCPGCGAALPFTALESCPTCGRYWGMRRIARAAFIMEVVAAGALCFVALLVTLPVGWMAFAAVSGNVLNHPEMGWVMLWPSWIWGLPVLSVAFAWRENVLHNRPGTEGLLRVYRRTQLVTLSVPIAVAMVGILVCGLAGW